MCDELGNDEHMTNYILEAGKTSLCAIEDGEGCSDKERGFIDKWKDKTHDKVTAQLTRLNKMSSGKMKPALAKWISQRVAILNQFADKFSHKEEL